MELNASIVERLQQLRLWQISQQERLLKQQQEQRTSLTIEQKRMYEVLSANDIIDNESLIDQMSVSKQREHVESCPDNADNRLSPLCDNVKDQTILDEDSNDSQDEEQWNGQLKAPTVSLKTMTNKSVDDLRPEPSDSERREIEETPRRFLREHFESSSVAMYSPSKSGTPGSLIDDQPLPLPSSNKDFAVLLEEKLRDSENHNVNNGKQTKSIKRPFLKKGEGLARFRMNRSVNTAKKIAQKSESGAQVDVPHKVLKNTLPQKSCQDRKINKVPPKALSIPKVAQRKLNLKNTIPPKKPLQSTSSSRGIIFSPTWESRSNITSREPNDELNQSDLDSSKLETKIFELLEEKAENSSFCSTSSAVVAFVQQSTPSKLKTIFKDLSTAQQVRGATGNINNGSKKTNKITLSSKSNSKTRVLPYIQEGLASTKWTSDPFAAENSCNLSCSTEVDTENNDNDSTVSYSVKNHDEKSREDRGNAIMHVRFAEYDEYKMYGLTDTSLASTNSEAEVLYVKKDDSNEYSSSESSESSGRPLKPDDDEEPLDLQVSNSYQASNAPSSAPNSHTSNDLHSSADCDEAESCDENSTLHETDDECSDFSDSEGTNYDEENTISELEENMRKVLHNGPTEMVKPSRKLETCPLEEESQTADATSTIYFKSELLKERLLELEHEIDIFRKQNAALSQQRQKWDEEQRRLQQELKEQITNLERDRSEIEKGFQDERKRLAREKAALENRLLDAKEKSLQTKQERLEARNLKKQLDELREEMNEKESRWQAAQARQRSQIRVLQMENAKLKQEIEALETARRSKNKAKKLTTISNTKAIHQINQQLDRKKIDSQNKDSLADRESTDQIVKTNNYINQALKVSFDPMPASSDNSRNIDYQTLQKTKQSISNKRFLYENLLKEATENNENCPNVPNTEDSNRKIVVALENVEESNDHSKTDDMNPASTVEVATDSSRGHEHKSPTARDSIQDTSDEKSEHLSSQSGQPSNGQKSQRSYQQFVRDILNPHNEPKQVDTNWGNSHMGQVDQHLPQMRSSTNEVPLHDRAPLQPSPPRNSRWTTYANHSSRDRELNQSEQKSSDEIMVVGNQSNLPRSDPGLMPREQHEKQLPRPSIHAPNFSQESRPSNSPSPAKPASLVTNTIREVKHLDGHTEYWYPNGNVKRVYPDRNLVKIIFYNGDVQETTADNCVKYFYAATNTWHTTYPDGFEILEYPDGQQERRTKDGVVEVSFPDGSIRLKQPDGVEKYALPDGTIAETFPNGDKILSLPNGEREIHTSSHKRREYPDGNVKFVYPNGSQETRYSNGRVRIRDKDGNLIMDSFQQ